MILFSNMRFIVMFVTAVYVLFLKKQHVYSIVAIVVIVTNAPLEEWLDGGTKQIHAREGDWEKKWGENAKNEFFLQG